MTRRGKGRVLTCLLIEVTCERGGGGMVATVVDANEQQRME